MSANPVRVECILQDDPRLLDAIPVIVSHASQIAGISKEIAQRFASDALDACRKAFACLERQDQDPAIVFVVDRFQDRVEITIEYDGERISLAEPGATNRPAADRVQHENSDGRSRVRFTKFCDALGSKRAE